MASNNESMFVCFYRSYFWLFLTLLLHILSVIILFRIEKLPGFSKWLTLVRVFVLVQNVFHISIANVSDSCKNCRIKGYFIHVMITSRTSRTHGLHLHLISRFFFLFWYWGWLGVNDRIWYFYFFAALFCLHFFDHSVSRRLYGFRWCQQKMPENNNIEFIICFTMFHGHTLWCNKITLFGKAF